MRLFSVDGKDDPVRQPFQSVDMEFFPRPGNKRAPADCRTSVRFLCVDALYNHVGIISHMFHNVDLPGSRPVSVNPVGRQHPDRRPGSSAGRQFCAGFNFAVQPVAQVLGQHPGGSIIAAVIFLFFSQFNGKDSVFNGRVSFSHVVLLFAVSPAVSAGVIGPAGRIRQSVGIKLVCPDQFIVQAAEIILRTGRFSGGRQRRNTQNQDRQKNRDPFELIFELHVYSPL